MPKSIYLAPPFPKGKNIKENFVGANFANDDSVLILSHFKGHAMGGFGGAVKNMSIGIASGEGKMWIHTAGVTKSLDDFALCFKTEQDLFLESMAEAAGSVMNMLGDKIVYINLMNNLSIDCDCDKKSRLNFFNRLFFIDYMVPKAGFEPALLDVTY